MKQNLIETIVGFAILLLAGFFLNFAYKKSNMEKPSASYLIFANFDNSEGIAQGSDVMIAGIKVGYVENITLDYDSFMSKLTFRLDRNIKLPVDSKATVTSSGFLGGKFIAIAPGQEEENLAENAKIRYTQSSISIETLISKFMYSLGSKD